MNDEAREKICLALARDVGVVGREEVRSLATLRGRVESEDGPDAPLTAMLRAQEGLMSAGVEDLNRRADGSLRVVLMGRTQAGKSTLFCALTGAPTDLIGNGAQATTRAVQSAPAHGLPAVDVYDTPGVGALDRPEDRRIALDAAREADVVLWVLTNDSFQQEEQNALDEVLACGTPVLLVLNCLYDLSTPDRLQLFLEDVEDHPVRVIRRDEGHLVRPRNTFSRRGQASVIEIPVHALAYLWTLTAECTDLHPTLRAVSNIEVLLEALRIEATKYRHARRATATCDHLRALLSELASLCEFSARQEEIAAEVDGKAAEEAQRLVTSLLQTAQGNWRLSVATRLASFSGWADGHYRDPDAEVRKRLQTDFKLAQKDLQNQMIAEATTLERKIARRLNDSAQKWSDLQVESMRVSVPKPDLPGRLRAVAPDAVLAGVGLVAVVALGAPAAAVAVGLGFARVLGTEKLLGRLFGAAKRRRALQEHRARLQGAVDEQVAQMTRRMVRQWATKVDLPQRDRLSSHCELLRQRSRRRTVAASRLRTHAAACRHVVAGLDLSLVRALRALEGDSEGASLTSRVFRRPGALVAVEVADVESARREATQPHDYLRNVSFVPESGACDDLRRVALLSRPSAERPWRLRRRSNGIVLVAPRQDLLPAARQVAEASTDFLEVPVDVVVRTEMP